MKDLEQIFDDYDTISNFRHWLSMDSEHDVQFYNNMILALAEKIRTIDERQSYQ